MHQVLNGKGEAGVGAGNWAVGNNLSLPVSLYEMQTPMRHFVPAREGLEPLYKGLGHTLRIRDPKGFAGDFDKPAK